MMLIKPGQIIPSIILNKDPKTPKRTFGHLITSQLKMKPILHHLRIIGTKKIVLKETTCVKIRRTTVTIILNIEIHVLSITIEVLDLSLVEVEALVVGVGTKISDTILMTITVAISVITEDVEAIKRCHIIEMLSYAIMTLANPKTMPAIQVRRIDHTKTKDLANARMVMKASFVTKSMILSIIMADKSDKVIADLNLMTDISVVMMSLAVATLLDRNRITLPSIGESHPMIDPNTGNKSDPEAGIEVLKPKAKTAKFTEVTEIFVVQKETWIESMRTISNITIDEMLKVLNHQTKSKAELFELKEPRMVSES